MSPRALLFALIASASAACAVASGTTSGGDARWDAQARVDPNLCAIPVQGGASWAELYRDYFGPEGKGSCASNVACHVPIKGAMGFEQSGFGCPDKDGCWASLTAQGDGGVLLQPFNGAPSKLEWSLRKEVAVGRNDMPSNSCQTFTKGDVQRIRDWMAAGAKND